MNPLFGTLALFQQINSFLEKIDAISYTQPLEAFNGSTIGQHLRHIVDFYRCFLNGIEQKFIDYDKRERNPQIEQSPAVTSSVIHEIAMQMETLDIQKLLFVNTSFTNALEEEAVKIPSSVGRELMYAYDHAIHHLAIVKIGVQIHFPDLEIPKDLGVAPSTLKYRKIQTDVSAA